MNKIMCVRVHVVVVVRLSSRVVVVSYRQWTSLRIVLATTPSLKSRAKSFGIHAPMEMAATPTASRISFSADAPSEAPAAPTPNSSRRRASTAEILRVTQKAMQSFSRASFSLARSSSGWSNASSVDMPENEQPIAERLRSIDKTHKSARKRETKAKKFGRLVGSSMACLRPRCSASASSPSTSSFQATEPCRHHYRLRRPCRRRHRHRRTRPSILRPRRLRRLRHLHSPTHRHLSHLPSRRPCFLRPPFAAATIPHI